MKKIFVFSILVMLSYLFNPIFLKSECAKYWIEVKYIIMCPGESECADLWGDEETLTCPQAGISCWKEVTWHYNSFVGNVSKGCESYENFYKIEGVLPPIKYVMRLEDSTEISFMQNSYNIPLMDTDFIKVISCPQFPELEGLQFSLSGLSTDSYANFALFVPFSL